MIRGKVIMTTGAVFAIGLAFAAQPTSVRADRLTGELRQPTPWAPGTDGVIAALDTSTYLLTPPR
ncbi:MAG TPA: hypothetical protein VK437_00010 [Steroidobacteraceae bacterium]|nr:hypothetical protein [Steroidobacteraceae bacterium]